MLKDYIHIPDFLNRFIIFKLGNFMIRFHEILSPDTTPYLHSHPFFYISIILQNGYVEQYLKDGKLITKTHKKYSIIFRKSSTYHRIQSITNGTCKTLFFCFYIRGNGQNWNLIKHKDIVIPETYNDYPDGIYKFNLGVYRKRYNGFWYKLNRDVHSAIWEDNLSIRQVIKPNEIKEYIKI